MLETLLQPLAEMEVWAWEAFLSDWVFVISMAVLVFELLRYAFLKRLGWLMLGDALTSFVTQALFIGMTVLFLGTFYIVTYYTVHEFALFEIEATWLSLLVCIVLADLTYYWEHRFTHRVAAGWATHSVHHSSTFFNMSVAYRFGPMDGIWPVFFHIPLILMGFDPAVVLFSEILVQLYQTFLHTEAVRKLPKPIEAIFNTPSHHRVHHGSNPEYLDKNYGGVLIVWDRMFGTFAEEKEKVDYGLVTPIASINPIVVTFHGFYRLGKELWAADGIAGKFRTLVAPPGENRREAETKASALHPAE